jgi:hypothetical protein
MNAEKLLELAPRTNLDMDAFDAGRSGESGVWPSGCPICDGRIDLTVRPTAKNECEMTSEIDVRCRDCDVNVTWYGHFSASEDGGVGSGGVGPIPVEICSASNGERRVKTMTAGQEHKELMRDLVGELLQDFGYQDAPLTTKCGHCRSVEVCLLLDNGEGLLIKPDWPTPLDIPGLVVLCRDCVDKLYPRAVEPDSPACPQCGSDDDLPF